MVVGFGRQLPWSVVAGYDCGCWFWPSIAMVCGWWLWLWLLVLAVNCHGLWLVVMVVVVGFGRQLPLLVYSQHVVHKERGQRTGSHSEATNTRKALCLPRLRPARDP